MRPGRAPGVGEGDKNPLTESPSLTLPHQWPLLIPPFQSWARVCVCVVHLLDREVFRVDQEKGTRVYRSGGGGRRHEKSPNNESPTEETPNVESPKL